MLSKSYPIFWNDKWHLHRTLHFSLSLVGVHSAAAAAAAASMWAATKFLYSSFKVCFGCLMKSIEFVSYIYHVFNDYISISKWTKRVVLSVCFLFRRRLWHIFAVTILWSRDIISKKGIYLTVQNAIYPLFVYEYIIYLYFSVIWVGVGP